ncbi:XRE family transcriptional regulator [Hymenobacter sediminis]|uniref:helix-turn-helix domain-containing protein n=1 Tax=Hymenobacter sediminis TaxID=2218621 RepID=UPI000DA6A8AF|nr:helix-turn-helix transcriptional regulator [Hymenobacter sediminis]RPD44121.1 XRE family transcriptional regulator [Hymenobacter sediminis]
MKELTSEAVASEIVRRLQELRRERLQTQQEVYDATGVHIGRLEAQRANMTLRTLVILTRYYDVSLTELFQGL